MRYQDVDFVVRCLLSVDSWTYTPGLDVLYVHHEGPQITDTYSEGRQHREMFDGLSDYWDQAQALIPRQNHTLVRQAAAALAWNSAVDGQGADARAMLRFAAAGPGALSRARAIVPPLVLSLVSPKTLAAARRAKRWLRERQGAMGVAPS